MQILSLIYLLFLYLYLSLIKLSHFYLFIYKLNLINKLMNAVNHSLKALQLYR